MKKKNNKTDNFFNEDDMFEELEKNRKSTKKNVDTAFVCSTIAIIIAVVQITVVVVTYVLK